MSSLRDVQLEYEEVSIKAVVSENNRNIRNILHEFNDSFHDVHVGWDELSSYIINPKSDLLKTILIHLKDLPEQDYHLLSSTSVASASMSNTKNTDSDRYLIDNFIRGISVIITLSYLIYRHRYIRINMLPSDYEIFTRNNLKVLRMGIIMHLKCIDNNNMLLKHGLDFINRWSSIFVKGDSVDKNEALLELISNYLCKQIIKTDEIKDNLVLEKRITRLENLMGII